MYPKILYCILTCCTVGPEHGLAGYQVKFICILQDRHAACQWAQQDRISSSF